MKLSPAAIRTLALPPDRGEAIYFDDEQPGFGLRLRSGGSRVFIYGRRVLRGVVFERQSEMSSAESEHVESNIEKPQV